MEKKIPERMCIVCRGKNAKEGLIRIVRDKSGTLFIDRTGKAAGRGAYICLSEQCIGLAQKKKALDRTFKTAVDGGIYDSLKEQLSIEK